MRCTACGHAPSAPCAVCVCAGRHLRAFHGFPPLHQKFLCGLRLPPSGRGNPRDPYPSAAESVGGRGDCGLKHGFRKVLPCLGISDGLRHMHLICTDISTYFANSVTLRKPCVVEECKEECKLDTWSHSSSACRQADTTAQGGNAASGCAVLP